MQEENASRLKISRPLAWYARYVKGDATPARPPEQPAAPIVKAAD